MPVGVLLDRVFSLHAGIRAWGQQFMVCDSHCDVGAGGWVEHGALVGDFVSVMKC